MYKEHFGLRKKPFAVTPDPAFLYQGASHREALASLRYGIHERRGFIALVGEVGTGKSTLIRTLLEDLGSNVRTALITHTTVSRIEILRMILHELHIGDEGMTRVKMLRFLNEFAINELKENRAPPVLILDEAQDLSHDVLEEVRLLTNLEISQSKLLQVILSGQPELETKLHEPSLRQLRQRIAVYIRLRPLTRREAYEYVAHRLRVAGCRSGGLFTQDATFHIWRVSGGIPRVINMICEQSLINAFGAAKHRIDLSLVEEAVRDLDLIKEDDSKKPFWKKTFRWRKPDNEQGIRRNEACRG